MELSAFLRPGKTQWRDSIPMHDLDFSLMDFVDVTGLWSYRFPFFVHP